MCGVALVVCSCSRARPGSGRRRWWIMRRRAPVVFGCCGLRAVSASWRSASCASCSRRCNARRRRTWHVGCAVPPPRLRRCSATRLRTRPMSRRWRSVCTGCSSPSPTTAPSRCWPTMRCRRSCVRRWMEYFVRRAEGLPLAALVAGRPGVGPGSPSALAAAAGCGVTRLQPLSRTAVGRLLARDCRSRLAAEFTDACHRVTGGSCWSPRYRRSCVPSACRRMPPLARGSRTSRRRMTASAAGLPCSGLRPSDWRRWCRPRGRLRVARRGRSG